MHFKALVFLFASAFLSFSITSTALSQSRANDFGTGGIHTIQGRIYLPSGKIADSSMIVRLDSTTFSSITVSTDVNGGFIFRSLAPGNYTVVVEGNDVFETAREYVTIEATGGRVIPSPKVFTLPIYLALKQKVAQRVAVINAKLAQIPKAAMDLYEEAQKSITANDMVKATNQLRQAISAYNAFSLAWNDLGVILEKSGDARGAVSAFRSAVTFDPDSNAAVLNLGSALTQAKQYSEAEKYLAIALSRDPSIFRGHFYMGITEAKLGRLDIAEKAFQKAISIGGDGVGKAHYYLAGVYWASKKYKPAADELEKYLATERDVKDAAKVRQSIAELRSKQ